MFEEETEQPDCPEQPLSFQLNVEQSAVFTVQPVVTQQLHSLNTEQSWLVQEHPVCQLQLDSSQKAEHEAVS